jgi:hypothetical protein
VRDVLEFVRDLLGQAGEAQRSPYNKGFNDALNEVAEWIRSEMWERGEDEDD